MDKMKANLENAHYLIDEFCKRRSYSKDGELSSVEDTDINTLYKIFDFILNAKYEANPIEVNIIDRNKFEGNIFLHMPYVPRKNVLDYTDEEQEKKLDVASYNVSVAAEKLDEVIKIRKIIRSLREKEC